MSSLLHIRNMVCPRCIAAVRQLLEERGYEVRAISLGEAEINADSLSPDEKGGLQQALTAAGFSLIDDQNSRLIEGIRTVIIGAIHHREEPPREKYSELLSTALQTDYATLSRLFSETEGITIEQYILRQKAERVKELLTYGDLSLGDIAFRMGYSSTAHLSSQFKKTTGMTPTQFKALRPARRPLDEVGRERR